MNKRDQISLTITAIGVLAIVMVYRDYLERSLAVQERLHTKTEELLISHPDQLTAPELAVLRDLATAWGTRTPTAATGEGSS